MKTLKFISLYVLMFIASCSMQSQVSMNVNLGVQPSWGPVGYTSVNYYYLPDVQAYYDVRSTQFIYISGGKWIRSSYLPRQYRNYDLNRGYKVVLNDYHGTRPYYNYKYHKQKYYKGYSRPQKTIGYRTYNHGNYWKNGHNKGEEKKVHGNSGHGKK